MKLDLDAFERLRQKLTNTPLGEADLGLRSGELTLGGTWESGALRFDAGGQAALEIVSFNAPTDVDELGVLGGPARAGDAGAVAQDPTQRRPQLPLEACAYVRYAVAAQAKAGAGVSLPYLAADAQGRCSVVFADYRRHALTDKALEALVSDLAPAAGAPSGPRCAAIPDDVLKLGAGDAVALVARAKVSGSVKVRWADVFTSNVNRLAELLRARTPLSIEIDTGLAVDAAIGVEDDFALVFSRKEAGSIALAVKKAVSRAPSLGASLAVEVSFSDPDAVSAAAGALVRGVIGTRLDIVDALFAKTDPTQLDDTERKILDKVIDHFELGDVVDTWEHKREAWLGWRARAVSRIEEIAKSRIGAGFRYEYQRLSEHAALLEATLPDGALEAVHGDLVRGDIAAASRTIHQRGLAASITSYFDQALDERSASWGFALNLGRWSFEGKDARHFRRVVQTSANAEQRIAYGMVRSYTGTMFGTTAWTVDFKADMPAFASRPRVPDFSFGLHLLYEHREKKLGDDELRQVIDEAIAWRVLDEDDEATAFAAIAALRGEKGDRPVVTHLEVKLDDDAFRAVLPLLAADDVDASARALARALPWFEPTGRSFVPLREELYAPLWRAYLKDPSMTPADLGAIAVRVLGQDPRGKSLRLLESHPVPASLRESVRLNGEVRRVMRSVRAGFRTLAEARRDGGGADTIPEVFALLEPGWTQYLYVRAFGALVVGAADRALGGLAAVERTLSATAGDRRLVLGVGK